ncbi:MAG: hypothetical protein U5J96_05800 [Ignavibacteriaceae bacterium]|nr:hypothetical protein [Ignavibacteriaceae bacterium]
MIKIYYLALCFILSLPIHSQINREEALKQGGWSGGLAGWVGWENFDLSESSGDVTKNV